MSGQKQFNIIDKGKKFTKGRFYWYIKAVNGRTLCHSETYNTRRAAVKGALSAFKTISQYVQSQLRG